MKKGLIAYPYVLWMIVFTVIPLLMILFLAFTDTTSSGDMVFSLKSIYRCFEPIYLKVIWKSIYLAFISTVLCLILGYPMAYFLTRMPDKWQSFFTVLLVVPMWMNFLLRTYAWLALLGQNGLINTTLEWLNLPTLHLLYTDKAVILGMIYNFLPFMILPIYSVLQKLDLSMIEAASDLGANGRHVFTKIIFPLSLGGVVSGITMVFLPAVTTFVISQLLGGGQYTLIGNLIEQQYRTTGNWHFGGALSVLMMLMLLLSIGIMRRYEKESQGGGLM